mgnify:CR=1 FL=1
MRVFKVKVPGYIFLTVTLLALAALADFAYSTINAKDPIHYNGPDYCIKCHSDAKTLNKMKDKAGDFWVNPLPPNHPEIKKLEKK